MTAETPAAQRATADDGTVALTMDVRVGPGALEIGYWISTSGALPVLVFDLPRTLGADGQLKVDRGTAWVAFEEPETLVVKRGIPRLPRLRSVEAAREPYARRLEPGRSLDGRVLLELPAAESNPYYPVGEGAAFRKAEARRLRFELTYIVLAGGLVARAVAGVPDAFELDRSGETGGRRRTATLQAFLEARVSIAVRRRSDPFEPA